jgi:hypothetical protein
VRVRAGSELIATLPGIFDDGRIRSYTGSGGEERFFLLVKQGEALELAVNDLLEPLTGGLLTADALTRVRLATALIEAMRRLFREFASRPSGQSMPADHFLDVFRQFAVHWSEGDIPPSGALDPEALKRDFLLGMAVPGYEGQVRRLFPALLDTERDALESLMGQPTLPQRLLASLGLDETGFAALDGSDLARVVGEQPGLRDWYRLLAAHARAAGAHLMLSKKFLFKPQQRRDATGIGDRPLVSNRAGTTGMNEDHLERLTRARQRHALAPLKAVLGAQTAEISTEAGVPSHFEVDVSKPL